MQHFFWNAMRKRLASSIYYNFISEKITSKVKAIILLILFVGVHVWIGIAGLNFHSPFNIAIVGIMILEIFALFRQIYKLVNHTFHEEDDLY